MEPTMPNYLLDRQETERLWFRKLQPSDFEQWLPFHQDPRSSQYWGGLPQDPIIACEEQFDRTFERYQKDLGGMNVLICKTTGAFIGICGLLIQTVDTIEELEIGYSILPEHWQKGYATEAALKCRKYAFENNLAQSVISIIQVNNTPSQKVAKNNGMTLDKTTSYHNNQVHIFRIRQ